MALRTFEKKKKQIILISFLMTLSNIWSPVHLNSVQQAESLYAFQYASLEWAAWVILYNNNGTSLYSYFCCIIQPEMVHILRQWFSTFLTTSFIYRK